MTMRRIGYIAGVLGLIAFIVLIAREGWSEVYSAIDNAGWALLWLLPFHVLPLWMDAAGWRVLLSPRDPQRRATIGVLFWIATIREASNRLLPLAGIGGDLIGIRLVRWRGIRGVAAAASVIVEVLLTMVNQCLFVALGVGLLVMVTVHAGTLGSVLIAVLVSILLPIALFVLLRHGNVFTRLAALSKKVLGDDSRLAELMNGPGLDTEIRALYSRRRRLLVACIWQFLGLLIGSFESWLGLWLLGYPVTIVEAIAIEAATQALRNIIFVVPGGLGVQEGGLILFGSLIGLPPDACIALSLVKRMRELVFGVPALISWHWAETNRLRASWLARETARNS